MIVALLCVIVVFILHSVVSLRTHCLLLDRCPAPTSTVPLTCRPMGVMMDTEKDI